MLLFVVLCCVVAQRLQEDWSGLVLMSLVADAQARDKELAQLTVMSGVRERDVTVLRTALLSPAMFGAASSPAPVPPTPTPSAGPSCVPSHFIVVLRCLTDGMLFGSLWAS